MKKRRQSRIGRVFSKIINLRQWSDYDRVKAFTRYLANGFKRMFIPQTLEKSKAAESFEQAVKAQKLSPMQLQANQKALLWLSVFMCITAAVLFGYAIFQMIYGSITATLISLVVMCIALALAFRYHFWYYQMKSRKLGISFREWFRHGLMGEK